MKFNKNLLYDKHIKIRSSNNHIVIIILHSKGVAFKHTSPHLKFRYSRHPQKATKGMNSFRYTQITPYILREDDK